jgi:hypothetical protein
MPKMMLTDEQVKLLAQAEARREKARKAAQADRAAKEAAGWAHATLLVPKWFGQVAKAEKLRLVGVIYAPEALTAELGCCRGIIQKDDKGECRLRWATQLMPSNDPASGTNISG